MIYVSCYTTKLNNIWPVKWVASVTQFGLNALLFDRFFGWVVSSVTKRFTVGVIPNETRDGPLKWETFYGNA